MFFLLVFLLLAACGGFPAMRISPMFPQGADTVGLAVNDARHPSTEYGHEYGEIISAALATPAPLQSKILGDVNGLVLELAGPRTVADAIATLVAKKYPGSSFTLLDCRSLLWPGLFLRDFRVYLAIKIEAHGGAIVLEAKGSNLMARPVEENFNLAFEEALRDLARKIESAPSDPSRAVN